MNRKNYCCPGCKFPLDATDVVVYNEANDTMECTHCSVQPPQTIEEHFGYVTDLIPDSLLRLLDYETITEAQFNNTITDWLWQQTDDELRRLFFLFDHVSSSGAMSVNGLMLDCVIDYLKKRLKQVSNIV